jgi:hypothetical protein
VGDDGRIVRYDGASWRQMMGIGQKDLLDVWGAGPDHVFAVGEEGTIRRYGGVGDSWLLRSSGQAFDLFGIWTTSHGHVLAVGDDGLILRGIR